MPGSGSGTIRSGMRPGNLLLLRPIARRLAVGAAALCAVASLPAVSQAAGSLADTGSRLAYVDPGSGSFILQALVATLAGAAVAINAYWSKIKRIFGRETPDDDEAKDESPSDD